MKLLLLGKDTDFHELTVFVKSVQDKFEIDVTPVDAYNCLVELEEKEAGEEKAPP